MTSDPLDLDKLERAVAAMTPGPLLTAPAVGTDERDRALSYMKECHAPGSGPLHVVYIPCDEPGLDHLAVAITGNGPTSKANAAGIVALRNAAPELIARVRKLEAVIRRILDTEHGSGAEHDAMCDARALIAHDLKPIDKEADRG